MSNESYPHSNPHPSAHDADSGCASEPTPPPAACEPTPPSHGGDSGGTSGILPSIDISAAVKADLPIIGVGADASADVSLGSSETSTDGLDIDVSLTTPDVGGLLGGSEGEGGYPLVSLDSETDAVVNVPLFGESGILGGTHDVGSLLTAAMLDIGGNGGGLGAIIGADVYDGNVPLATDLSSALGSTLDLLTTTSSLFDVPALDILGCDGLDS